MLAEMFPLAPLQKSLDRRLSMDLFIHEAIINGFGAFEFDLPTRLNAADVDPAEKARFLAIIAAIVDVLNSPNAGAALAVAGHADRHDVAGLSHIERLAVEKNSSVERMKSALQHVHDLVKQAEPTAPSDLNTLPFFDVNTRAPGAGVLEADEDNLSEARRRLNRRVQVRLLVYKP
jgi:hypothetical protein